ncbi:MFS transporter [Burkholderia pseudomultivorans]|uniref:MFS transporter n=1 Tax=Burkholderia pseudomultivorans TaxID=1207504 RepID=A0A132E5J8_9BURK|nr:MFS transporter [Burkholderia pseudomultivorans]KWF17314.1 MFS transporter [Burkholderia pseudomultivorans]
MTNHDTAREAAIPDAAAAPARAGRYLQLALLVCAAGAIYSMLYLRQFYQHTMLDLFRISRMQLSYLYSALGVTFLICYLPSGWLADRLSPRGLIGFSLAATGALGFWYASAPSYGALLAIFCGWGLTTGLAFWTPVIKHVKTIALPTEQGRFFGFLDGGRGLIEALLATASLACFAWLVESPGVSPAGALRQVIVGYSVLCIALGVLLLLVKDASASAAGHADDAAPADKPPLVQDLLTLARNRRLWVFALIVFCGYHLSWAIYSISPYLQQEGVGMSIVAAGFVASLKLWMRPVGGIGGGFIGDRVGTLNVLGAALFFAALALVALIVFPSFNQVLLFACVVTVIGLLTYAVRGLYWSVLERCDVPPRITGLAIGIISLLGYSPDVFLPLLNGWLTTAYPGMYGYQLYFGYVACASAVGGGACLVLKGMLKAQATQ